MDIIPRELSHSILKYMKPNKVVMVLGARRTGKTFLIKSLIEENELHKYLLLNGEDLGTLDLLKEKSIENYKQKLAGYNYLLIDEAQKIPEIGLKLKLIVDNIEGIKILVTGSSAFDIANRLGEPLTGRSFIFHLFPLALMEFIKNENLIETIGRLETRLVYGNYPELINLKGNDERAKYLTDLVNSYLLKDILTLDGIRNSDKILDLLRLIAFQIGHEVSLNELSNTLGLHKATIEKYLDLLSKVFVIFRLGSFSRNLRKEITKSQKWYFFDNGIRNILINNVNSLNLRNDIGQLWENYLVSERIKFQSYTGMLVSNFFWRTYQKQEIDWIEEREGNLFAYEIKWEARKKTLVPTAWKEAYPNATFEVIDKNNYINWLMK